jgi:hypothetical protein
VQQAIAHENNDESGLAIRLYEEVVKENIADQEDLTEEVIKAKEQATYKLANIFKSKGLDDELIKL